MLTQEEVFGWICGLVMGAMVIVGLMYLARPSPIENLGYIQAYEDMHQGKIESVVKERFPQLWIKYNVKGK